MKQAWICRDKILPLGEKTYVMGIVNVTPDSFSDGGRWLDPSAALAQAQRLEAEGVDLLDFGGQSTRPGHTEIPPEEEWARLEPVLRALDTRLPISIDTYYPYVAQRALALGVHIINDVSGVVNRPMAEAVSACRAGWVLMHNGKIPAGEDPVQTVSAWLRQAAREAEALGVAPETICLDPGIGFGKDEDMENYALIRRTAELVVPGYAYLLGASRKRCIGSAAGVPAAQRDAGTIAAHTIGIWGGAHIIRTHAGAPAVQAARVADAIKRGEA